MVETCDECGKPMSWCATHSVFHHKGTFSDECREIDESPHDYFG